MKKLENGHTWFDEYGLGISMRMLSTPLGVDTYIQGRVPASTPEARFWMTAQDARELPTASWLLSKVVPIDQVQREYNTQQEAKQQQRRANRLHPDEVQPFELPHGLVEAVERKDADLRLLGRTVLGGEMGDLGSVAWTEERDYGPELRFTLNQGAVTFRPEAFRQLADIAGLTLPR